MQLLRNDKGHIHIFHFALLAAIAVIAVVIIAHVITQTNLVGIITNLVSKVTTMIPHR